MGFLFMTFFGKIWMVRIIFTDKPTTHNPDDRWPWLSSLGKSCHTDFPLFVFCQRWYVVSERCASSSFSWSAIAIWFGDVISIDDGLRCKTHIFSIYFLDLRLYILSNPPLPTEPISMKKRNSKSPRPSAGSIQCLTTKNGWLAQNSHSLTLAYAVPLIKYKHLALTLVYIITCVSGCNDAKMNWNHMASMWDDKLNAWHFNHETKLIFILSQEIVQVSADSVAGYFRSKLKQ